MKLKSIYRRINYYYCILSYVTACTSVILLFLFASCSGEDKKMPVDEAGIQTPAENTAKTENKFLKLNVCELVPGELLAETLGGKIKNPAQSTESAGIHGCSYEIDPAGRDNSEICMVWFNPPSYFQSAEDLLETDRGLGQESTSEKLEEYGDEAFVIHNKTEEQSIIHVLLKDKVYLSVAVEHYEDARKLTELILSKLKDI